MFKILQGKWEVPWIIADMIQEITECMQNKIHISQHIMREGNNLADQLPNRAPDKGSDKFHDFKSLDIYRKMENRKQ